MPHLNKQFVLFDGFDDAPQVLTQIQLRPHTRLFEHLKNEIRNQRIDI